MPPVPTGDLEQILETTSAGQISAYFAAQQEEMAADDRPFATYMRGLLREKGLKQQDIFRAANISENYGYKLISQETPTRQRDVILRLCLSAGFSLTETDRALKLYGMSPLYARIPRDAVLIVAVNQGIRETDEVDALLERYGFPRLYACREAD